jgi:hypothetical protein
MKVSKAVSSAAPEHHRRHEYDQDSWIRLQRDKPLRAFGFDPQRAAWMLEEWHVLFCERIGLKIRSLHVRMANLRSRAFTPSRQESVSEMKCRFSK